MNAEPKSQLVAISSESEPVSSSPTKSVGAVVWARRTCQWFVGLVLLSTGLGKLLDVPGFMGVIHTYQFFPAWAEPAVAVAFVVAELRLAEWILRGRGVAGWGLARAGLASTVLHVCFTGWATLSLLRGLKIDNCGCFGVFLARPLTWGTVLEDVFMTGVSLALWRLAAREAK